MYGGILSKLGKLLAQYYLDLYHDSPLISLFIDKLTFEDVCRTSGLRLNDCIDSFHVEFPSEAISKDSYQSLALVVFQVIVSNDVNFNGIYDRLRAEIPSLNGVDNTTLMKRYFEDGQDQIWATVHEFFKTKKKEIFNFPSDKQYGPGRYVRYPLSQQLLPTRQIIQYADKFRQTLDPHMPYTYEEFKKRIKFNWNHDNELIKHSIFSFYQTWDGRLSQDYINRRTSQTRLRIIAKEETVLEVNEEFHIFSVFKYELNSKNLKKISSKKLLTDGVRFRIFGYNPDFQDWSLLRINGIPQEISYLGILTFPHLLQTLKIGLSDPPDVYNDGKMVFAIFDSDKACNDVILRLGLKKEILSMWLSGGIRIGYNTYSAEALPIIHFKNKQREIYVNTMKIKFENPLQEVCLKDLVDESLDNYCIKLPFCAPLRLKIASFLNKINSDDESILGFSSNKTSIHIYDKLREENPLIRGLKSFALLSIQPHDTFSIGERRFISHKKFFESKFVFRRKYYVHRGIR